MITRPLDLASRLRSAPRNFDALFYVNVGALALFFAMFGSRFVLAPGLGLDFRMPVLAGAMAGAATTQRVVSVLPSGQIFAADGLLNMAQLREWLQTIDGIMGRFFGASPFHQRRFRIRSHAPDV